MIFHFAAQPFVRRAYRLPAEACATNVLGTVEPPGGGAPACPGAKAVVVVTTDKCYDNREWLWGYRESRSRSAAAIRTAPARPATELAARGVPPEHLHERRSDGAAIATARAGNVIGGESLGVRSASCPTSSGRCGTAIRSSCAMPRRYGRGNRLEPLRGYLMLGERLGAAKADCRRVEFRAAD